LSGIFFLRRYAKKSVPKAITGYGNNQVKDQLADFFAGIFRLVPPLVNIDDAVKSARLIDRIASLAAAEKSC